MTMKIGEFNPLDKKFLPKTPEPGFSVARNRFIINDTIKKYDKAQAKKMAEWTDKFGERADAVATYLCGMGGASRSKSVEKYFGKQELARLRGQDIGNMLMREQEMLITDKQKLYEQKEAQKRLLEAASQPDKTYQLKHYAEKKQECQAGF